MGERKKICYVKACLMTNYGVNVVLDILVNWTCPPQLVHCFELLAE